MLIQNQILNLVAVLQTAVVALVVVTAAVKRRGKRRAVTKLDIKDGIKFSLLLEAAGIAYVGIQKLGILSYTG